MDGGVYVGVNPTHPPAISIFDGRKQTTGIIIVVLVYFTRLERLLPTVLVSGVYVFFAFNYVRFCLFDVCVPVFIFLNAR